MVSALRNVENEDNAMHIQYPLIDAKIYYGIITQLIGCQHTLAKHEAQQDRHHRICIYSFYLY